MPTKRRGGLLLIVAIRHLRLRLSIVSCISFVQGSMESTVQINLWE
jgi:hypothetical protein